METFPYDTGVDVLTPQVKKVKVKTLIFHSESHSSKSTTKTTDLVRYGYLLIPNICR